jgi:integrase
MIESPALLERQRPAPGATAARFERAPRSLAPDAGEAPAQNDGLSVAEGYARWHASHLALRKDGGDSVHRSMHKDVLPWIGALALAELQEAQIAELLQRIVARGAVRQAGCVLADIRQLLRWALREGLIGDDPSAGLNKQDFGGARTPRSRALNLDEVRELAGRLKTSRLAAHIRSAVWLILATGARIGEVASASWQDIDIESGIWTVPASSSHHGHEHRIILSRFAIRQFLGTEAQRRSPVWVFPSRDDTEPLSPKALGKQIRDRQRGVQIRGRSSATTMLLLSGGAWTPLDLRRTAASLMTQLGISDAVQTACLDQSIRSRSGARPAALERLSSRVDPESCREAFERLGVFLDSIERAPFENRAQSID